MVKKQSLNYTFHSQFNKKENDIFKIIELQSTL